MAQSGNKDIEKVRQKAMKHYEKAMKFRSKEKFPKVVKELKQTMKLFNEASSHKEVEKVALRLVEMALVEREHNIAANALMEAANAAIILNECIKAYEHYKSAINFYVDAPKINKSREIMHATCLASFIRLLQGRFDEGISFFKTNLKNNRFKNIEKEPLIQFTEGILNGIISKKDEYLDRIEDIQAKLGLKKGEMLLCEKMVYILREYLKFKIRTELEPAKIYAGDQFTFKILIEHPRNIVFIDSSLDHDTNRLEAISGLNSKEDGKHFSMDFKARVDGDTQVGPMTIVLQTEDDFKFPLTISKKFKILPGKPKVDVIIEEQQLLKGEKNQFDIILFNSGKGEASRITLELDFPETLLFVGGVNSKKLHSLKANARFPVSFLVTPLVGAELKGKYRLSYYNDYNEEFSNENDIEVKIF
ncbi:MAG: hypothetical protein ACTSRW_04995 [Candidatus Helarchaeota archaeon]